MRDLAQYLGLYGNATRRLLAQCGIHPKPREALTLAQVELVLKRVWFNRAKHQGFGKVKWKAKG